MGEKILFFFPWIIFQLYKDVICYRIVNHWPVGISMTKYYTTTFERCLNNFSF